MQCLDENQLLEFLEGQLDPEAASAVEEHIASCGECRALLSALGQVAAPGLAEAAPAPARQGMAGQILQNTYRLEQQIGKGGMGHVYRASHLRLERWFAIKVLSPQVAENREAWARFKREAKVSSKLAHPHIVEVIDFDFMPDGLPYIVMELLEGEDLNQRLRRDGPTLSIGVAGSILRQAASALQVAHAQGVVHRDLKPSNIFLCRYGSQDGFVKILDFGISKVIGVASDLTRSSTLLGSPAYMAPEQVDSRWAPVDHRTDVFAMGAILYRMLAGRSPFEGETVPELLYAIRHHEVEPMRKRRPDLPPALDDVVLRALEKRPELRQTSMTQLWQEFFASVDSPHAGLGLLSEPTLPALALPDEIPAAAGALTGPAGPRATDELTQATTITEEAALAETSVRLRQPAGERKRRRLLGLVGFALVLVAAGGWAFLLKGRPPEHTAPLPAPVSVPLRSDSAPRFREDAMAADARAAADTLLRADASAGLLRPDGSPGEERGGDRTTRRGPARRTARRGAARAAPGLGQLSVQTTSAADDGFLWAEVLLDGRAVGKTALLLRDVPEGSHLVEVRREGYRAQRKRITLRRGQQLPVHFRLAPSQR